MKTRFMPALVKHFKDMPLFRYDGSQFTTSSYLLDKGIYVCSECGHLNVIHEPYCNKCGEHRFILRPGITAHEWKEYLFKVYHNKTYVTLHLIKAIDVDHAYELIAVKFPGKRIKMKISRQKK